MKIIESWLHEWVKATTDRASLCKTLTMAGFEVEELTPVNNDKDYILDIAVTPNRGDCLSMRGMAREVSALTKATLTEMTIPPVIATCQDTLPISIADKSNCPRYLGRVIRNVKTNITTPADIKERLLYSDINSINPIVDVINYVMLELGQPMHAFDFSTIKQGINVRLSKQGEEITLLDGSKKILNGETLVIADQHNPIAIAGVMGGLDSSVTLLTGDIFLESAYFSPSVIAKQRQYYNLNSDSAYRFERGVDSNLQRLAIERATQLIIEIAGGEAGPVLEEVSIENLPQEIRIRLRAEKIEQVLGITIAEKTISSILTALHFNPQYEQGEWIVTVPSFRTDISIPEDLIEEIARLHGYEEIPTTKIHAVVQVQPITMQSNDWLALKQACSNHSYHEIISYSFVDSKWQALLNPQIPTRELLNPITADMAVMRTNLWPGLINALLYNTSRQQHRVRLFEIGTCFVTQNGKLSQEERLGGLISGDVFPEQWGIPSRKSDFYDVKGDIETIIHLPTNF